MASLNLNNGSNMKNPDHDKYIDWVVTGLEFLGKILKKQKLF